MRGFRRSATRSRAATLRSLAIALGVLALPIATAHASPATQIAALNAQRAANGIPAGIVEVPAWTEGCREHMAYIAANGGELTHDEQQGQPGYSADGAEVGRRAVISPLPEAFNSARNAFEFAPLHLMQTLAPALSHMGVWAGCATTNLGYDRKTRKPALYTYPGDGAKGFYTSERAFELPKVPGDFVGLPQGTTTGTHIFVMSLGTSAGRITSATLAGPGGPVAIRTVDNETEGLQGYMPPGGIIIPVAPLAPGTTYRATATFQPTLGPPTPLSRAWSFQTAGRGGAAPAPGSSPAGTGLIATMSVGNPRPTGHAVKFTLRADRRLAGQRATVTMFRVVQTCVATTCRERQQGRLIVSTIKHLDVKQRITAPRPVKGRSIVVIVQVKPFARAGVAFAASQAVGRWSAP